MVKQGENIVTPSANATQTARATKITEIPRWAMRWTYWNGKLYRLVPPDTLRAWHRSYRLHRPFKKYGIQDPILVYQMGKVASKSVYQSLLNLDLDVSVDHLHFLNHLDEKFENLQKTYASKNIATAMLKRARDARHEIETHPGKKWNVITLVRAPIPRAVSGFFHKLDVYFPSYLERIQRSELQVKDIADYFVTQYDDRMPNIWFDEQVKEVFGVNVYAHEFPKTAGYQILEHKNIRLLTLRAEDLNRSATEAFREFLHIPNFGLTNTNVGEQKAYAQVYRQFLDILKLPPDYIAKAHSTTYARHFYTENELAKSIAAWVSP